MKTLTPYISLVAFLGEALGKQCEVVLHDVTNLEHSIVAIANGEVSGRSVGAPATNFLLKLLQQANDHGKAPYVVNYYGKSANGHPLRSSSYFIHGDDGEVIGALCLNYDVQQYADLRRKLDALMLFSGAPAATAPDSHPSADVAESMYQTVEDAIAQLIRQELDSYAVPPERLSPKERLAIVRGLYKNGFFMLKGGLSALADVLGVSEPTIYRYLNQVKKDV